MCEFNELEGYTSPINVVNTYYWLKYFEFSSEEAKNIIRKFLGFIHIIESDKLVLLDAASSQFKDYEDAVQYFTALKIQGVEVIITHDIKDYKHSAIPVMTAEQFLKKFHS